MFITWLRHLSGHYNPVIIFCDNPKVCSNCIFSKRLKKGNFISIKIKLSLSGKWTPAARMLVPLQLTRLMYMGFLSTLLIYERVRLTAERDVGHTHPDSVLGEYVYYMVEAFSRHYNQVIIFCDNARVRSNYICFKRLKMAILFQ